jgi:hypothetical protein
LYDHFTSLVRRKERAEKIIEETFTKIFDEFREDIETYFVVPEIKRREELKQLPSAEKVTHEIFGRTSEEIEALKEQNRNRVVAFLQEHKNEAPSIELLLEMHAINNTGIIPQKFLRFREKEELIGFGKHFGILGDDVLEEMKDFEARAILLTLEKHPPGIYGAAVAKLHNDLLSIHPFLDRNGSSSLLFVEFMMSKKGYKPKEKRDKTYYARIRSAFGSNPIAVGIIAQGHYNISHVPGYYSQGKTTGAKRALYNAMLRFGSNK